MDFYETQLESGVKPLSQLFLLWGFFVFFYLVLQKKKKWKVCLTGFLSHTSTVFCFLWNSRTSNRCEVTNQSWHHTEITLALSEPLCPNVTLFQMSSCCQRLGSALVLLFLFRHHHIIRQEHRLFFHLSHVSALFQGECHLGLLSIRKRRIHDRTEKISQSTEKYLHFFIRKD